MATVSASTIKKVGAVAKAPVKPATIKATPVKAPVKTVSAPKASTIKSVASVAKAPAKPATYSPAVYRPPPVMPKTGSVMLPERKPSGLPSTLNAPKTSSVGSSVPKSPMQTSSAGQSGLPQVSRPPGTSLGSPLATQQVTKAPAVQPWLQPGGGFTPMPANRVPNFQTDVPIPFTPGGSWSGPSTPSYIPQPNPQIGTPWAQTAMPNAPDPQTNPPMPGPHNDHGCGGGDCAAKPIPSGGPPPMGGPPPISNIPPGGGLAPVPGGGELPPGMDQLGQMILAMMFPQVSQSMSVNMPQGQKLPGFAGRGFNGDGPYNSSMNWGDFLPMLGQGFKG